MYMEPKAPKMCPFRPYKQTKLAFLGDGKHQKVREFLYSMFYVKLSYVVNKQFNLVTLK